MLKKMIRCISVLLVAAFMTHSGSVIPVYAEQTAFYVSPDGSDSNQGTEGLPFKSFKKALAEAQKASGDVQIILRGGKHYVGSDINIDNSGTYTSLKITSYPGEKAVLSAGENIPVSYLRKTTDEDMLARLKPESRSHIYSVNLSTCGITNFGDMRKVEKDNSTTWAAPSFITINEKTAPRAQWPNLGYTSFKDGGLNSDSPVFKIVAENRADSWESIKDVWVYGCFNAEYADESAPIYAYDSATGEVKVQYNFYAGMSNSGKCQFLNIFEEIDMPNEWYIDKETGILYIYIEDIETVESIANVTTEKNMFNINAVSNVTFF